jgi:putative FmdB family regulatory protein
MPTYEYECGRCSLRFERQQSMKDAPVKDCPECGGEVRRMVSGGSGFIFKSSGGSRPDQRKSCSLEDTGRTYCGTQQRCGKPACGDKG